MIETIPPVEEIIEKLESLGYDTENGVDLGKDLRIYKAGNSVEIKYGKSGHQIIVERRFEKVPLVKKIISILSTPPAIRRYHKKYTLPTLEAAVQSCVDRLLKLQSEGVENYQDCEIL